jgi:hypothetical protein
MLTVKFRMLTYLDRMAALDLFGLEPANPLLRLNLRCPSPSKNSDAAFGQLVRPAG